MAHKRNDFLNQIRSMSDEDLIKKLNELRAELVRVRTQVVTGSVKDTMAVRNIRKNIARILTVISERKRGKAK